MCEILKDLNGDNFPHWHNSKTGKITIFVPEAPDERDIKLVVEALKTDNLQFLKVPLHPHQF